MLLASSRTKISNIISISVGKTQYSPKGYPAITAQSTHYLTARL